MLLMTIMDQYWQKLLCKIKYFSIKMKDRSLFVKILFVKIKESMH